MNLISFGVFFTIWFVGITISFGASAAAPTLNLAIDKEKGQFIIDNKILDDFGGEVRNYDIVQDSQGNLYFANNRSLFVYDGVRWQLIPATIGLNPRSLAIANDGKIYLGGEGHFGYIYRDQQARWSFHSLSKQISSQSHQIGTIRETIARPEGVYFRSRGNIYWWDQQNVHLIKPQQATFHRMFEVHDQLIVQHRRVGLSLLTNGQFKVLNNSDFFADKTIRGLLPLADDMLVVTSKHGLFRYASGEFSPFALSDDVTELLKGQRIYRATWLSNGQLAMAITGQHQGLLLLNEQGDLVRLVTISDGLSDDLINVLFEDHEQGLWLGTENGIDRVEVNGALTYFDQQQQLKGFVFSLIRHQQRLYVATSQGVFYLKAAVNGAVFQRVGDIKEICTKLISTSQGLLAACNQTIYHIDDHQVIELAHSDDYIFHHLHQLRHQADKLSVMVGHSQGLSLLSFAQSPNSEQPPSWQYRRVAQSQLQFAVMFIAEDQHGDLWLNSQTSGINRVRFANGFNTSVELSYFDSRHGLPKGGIFPSRIDDQVYLNTNSGLYQYNKDHQNTAQMFSQSRDLGD